MSLAYAATMARETPSESQESRLVASARTGDQEAFGELVRRHQRRVFRLAGRFFRQPDEVEDVAQETFLTAWRKLDTYRAKAPFEHWLTRVCLNCCYARLRKQRANEQAFAREPTAPRPDPDARVEVERLLGRLANHDRFVLLLLHGEGWSVAEIAERLGWSRVNVKVRAHRARQRLRRLMEEDLAS
jgi:RNA polymerase sigma-70 factor (ECF subfamily)